MAALTNTQTRKTRKAVALKHVVCCFAEKGAGTAFADLRRRLEDVIAFVDVSGDDLGYWRTLRTWWARGKTFVNMEHDLQATPDQLIELLNCRYDWCFLPTHIGKDRPSLPWPGLQVVKFSAALIARHPDLFDQLEPSERHWGMLCAGICNRLAGPHLHRTTAVRHLKLAKPAPVPDHYTCAG
jgi:hypothetical protein